MTDENDTTRSLQFEREMPHPPEKIWRALTLPHLISEWLLEADFEAQPGKTFVMEAEWGKVSGEVIAVDPERLLSYSWNGPGLTSKVTWTLEPTGQGTILRLEQTEIPIENKQAYYGARSGWPNFLDSLENLLARI